MPRSLLAQTLSRYCSWPDSKPGKKRNEKEKEKEKKELVKKKRNNKFAKKKRRLNKHADIYVCTCSKTVLV